MNKSRDSAFPPAGGWQLEIEEWARSYAERLSAGRGRLGVAVGGSIARGEHWQHSDLEIAVLVDEPDPSLTHFSVDEGRGVEIFQLECGRLKSELARVERGDVTPVASWPVQLYRSRVVHDATGLLLRFATEFDQHLFSNAVRALKVEAHEAALETALAEAEELLSSGRPRAALAMARAGVNERILTLHWALGELPRSQNRVDSRLEEFTERHDLQPFYKLFRDIFELDSTETAIRDDWPLCRDHVLSLTELWEGEASRAFFTEAVDSNFVWGEDGGIISVYRMYVPIIGAPTSGIMQSLDDPDWSRANTSLLRFLGLANADDTTVRALVSRLSVQASPSPLISPGELRRA